MKYQKFKELSADFWFLTPKARGNEFYFTSIMIFTPKPGLFDENPHSVSKFLPFIGIAE
jgi:hypothetical protein